MKQIVQIFLEGEGPTLTHEGNQTVKHSAKVCYFS